MVRSDRFTDAARQALVHSQQEARRLDHDYVGTEHLLLGLVGDPGSIAGRALLTFGAGVEEVRAMIEPIIGRGTGLPTGTHGLTPRARKVIELSIDEARRLGHHQIESGHLLLGLLREGNGIAAGVLSTFGVTEDNGRSAVLAARKAAGEP
jgi:ATP-dependent Clp protease ATP-binding subunit ClpC